MSRRPGGRAELLEGLHLAGRQLSAATIMFHQAIADRLGLNPTDHKCMDLLALDGAMTAGELAERTGLTTGAITGVVDRLEAAGFVRREDDPRDRRRVVLRLVPERCAEAGRLFEHLSRATAGLADRYSERELATILDFMTRSREVLRDATAELRRRPDDGPPAPRRRPARGRPGPS